MNEASKHESTPTPTGPDSAKGGPSSGDAHAAVTRRTFLKASVAGTAGVKGAIGGAVGLGAVGVGTYAVVKTGGTVHDKFPVPVGDDYKPMDQRNTVLTFAASKGLNDKHRVRIEKFNGFEFAVEGHKGEDAVYGARIDTPKGSYIRRDMMHLLIAAFLKGSVVADAHLAVTNLEWLLGILDRAHQ